MLGVVAAAPSGGYGYGYDQISVVDGYVSMKLNTKIQFDVEHDFYLLKLSSRPNHVMSLTTP